jgi:heme-degrading monooxygenase HmoA
MIKHVVLWRLKSNNDQAFETVRAALQAQAGRIPGMLRVEVGRNFSSHRRSVDFSVCCEFESREALAAYHKHPLHKETRMIVDPLVTDHWIVDYDV